MDDLTPRQTEILKTIIAEYTETGQAVGSEILDKKYNLGVSPATIRNEMVELSKKSYLKKEHFSAGRVPTAKAFRFYIQNIMQERELSTADEVSYKSDVWDHRADLHELLQTATRVLARRTGLLAVTTTDKGDVYYFGINNFLSNREFWDIAEIRSLFERFDENSYCNHIMDELARMENELLFMFEEKDASGICSSVFGEFKGKSVSGAIGVIGPRRMRYDVIVPSVRYFTSLINSIVAEQGM
ncbi:hypothetical protein A3D80_03295 [Candidatus Roizmanbacteria bacterium RIFCSPHIGHO2_02_FULL_40_13b]|uniref:Heat-inducible transcription repressor HrcA C-terminal domain-containing protein n=1 Tax=Candidatus Roizmanbacteria bacterium RIFCSPHIGHO2_01_FULL_39_24 TaxID=1802032 RepID=A0A1F7GLQ0_9BACT|nr:MAG: hypothetical protein A2799_01040 [Candidatus Roizmanbacteria bacterium RIFCSPHIGHO2_01_FULL_39_24]OGK26991.1 MAG: hypothetical protein A3D80_03295 [Candidatus Roizmanbacteria bacterium RIFCSPHIGHO2_02_FULL_40_13b]OGK48854.1 MAG: hypothetical protein A3A56_01430 [Candidatus Roizmanbacteria bacterium RIFCSPLOWO2_01_FULL_40_32]OGK56686.1 MAG: hypothetical protein A3H83_00690 [Candidatus Roizmanbacteria bacterium RIFCSPLOWO2_02_FULL_39_8]